MRTSTLPPTIYVLKKRVAKTMNIEYAVAQELNKLNYHWKKWEPLKKLLDLESFLKLKDDSKCALVNGTTLKHIKNMSIEFVLVIWSFYTVLSVGVFCFFFLFFFLINCILVPNSDL